MAVLLKIFQAGDGDCLVCEFDNGGKLFRLMVDGGVGSTFDRYTKAWLEALDGEVDLAVVTHIDDDHIGGMIAILNDAEARKKIKSIWFNGYKHLPVRSGTQSFSVGQGESLTKLIEESDIPWNEHFGYEAVNINKDGSPRVIDLSFAAKISILSPGIPELTQLKKAWDDGLVILEARAQAKLNKKKGRQSFGGINIDALADPLLYKKDKSPTNASSIAFLLEVGEHGILFAGDALAEVICESWIAGKNGVRPIDIFKVSHHGSAKNTNEDLLHLFPAPKYVISTSGEVHPLPDNATLARIITQGHPNPLLIFNHTNSITSVWSDTSVSNERHTAQYAKAGEVLEIRLPEL
ncbi:MBL fold metallo-hydrolase [Massilia aurea]|uniref:ComEC/Rec2 family competence protein n=1 Tax=Massilia aurea TaxID=373040 RepID=UPI0034633A6B